MRYGCDEQGFYLASLVYERTRQTHIVKEIFDAHYHSALRSIAQTPVDDRSKNFVHNPAVTFCRELEKYGELLKDHSFT